MNCKVSQTEPDQTALPDVQNGTQINRCVNIEGRARGTDKHMQGSGRCNKDW